MLVVVVHNAADAQRDMYQVRRGGLNTGFLRGKHRIVAAGYGVAGACGPDGSRE